MNARRMRPSVDVVREYAATSMLEQAVLSFDRGAARVADRDDEIVGKRADRSWCFAVRAVHSNGNGQCYRHWSAQSVRYDRLRPSVDRVSGMRAPGLAPARLCRPDRFIDLCLLAPFPARLPRQTPPQETDRRHEIPLPRRHHRRRLEVRVGQRPGHPRARQGDRGPGHRGRRRLHLHRRVDGRQPGGARVGLHRVDRRRGDRRRRPRERGGAGAAQVHHRDAQAQRRHPDLPVRRDAHLAAHPERDPEGAARLHPHVRGHAGVRCPLHHPRGHQLPELAGAAVLQGTGALRERRLVFVALPGPLGRGRVPEEPGRPDVPPVLRREHAARRRLQRGRRARSAARPHRAGGGFRAQCRAHLQCRPPVLRHQRHVDVEQDRLAFGGGQRRRGAGRPQLPQVDPARDHDDRHRADLPAADAQPPGHHRADPARGVRPGEHPAQDRGEPAGQGQERASRG